LLLNLALPVTLSSKATTARTILLIRTSWCDRPAVRVLCVIGVEINLLWRVRPAGSAVQFPKRTTFLSSFRALSCRGKQKRKKSRPLMGNGTLQYVTQASLVTRFCNGFDISVELERELKFWCEWSGTGDWIRHGSINQRAKFIFQRGQTSVDACHGWLHCIKAANWTRKQWRPSLRDEEMCPVQRHGLFWATRLLIFPMNLLCSTVNLQIYPHMVPQHPVWDTRSP
jgi:hypothetical protein